MSTWQQPVPFPICLQMQCPILWSFILIVYNYTLQWYLFCVNPTLLVVNQLSYENLNCVNMNLSGASLDFMATLLIAVSLWHSWTSCRFWFNIIIFLSIKDIRTITIIIIIIMYPNIVILHPVQMQRTSTRQSILITTWLNLWH